VKPERESCLVEVLDRLLEKGAVLSADLIISVAGIPLIGLNLRAALASMETMLKYGIMEDWDRSSRESAQREELPLAEDEEVLFRAFGYLQSQGALSSWLPGVWHLTSKRLILWRRSPCEVVFEVPLREICLLEADESEGCSELDLIYSGGSARIRLTETEELRVALDRVLRLRAENYNDLMTTDA
jgi:hypothetical protein